jgi:hypothetical protein
MNARTKLLGILGAAGLLTACVHQVPIPDVSNDMKQLDAAAQSRCARSGYQSGTPGFDQCVYSVKSQFLQAVMVPAPSTPDIRPFPPPPPPMQTRCYSVGNVTNCTTN